MAGGTWTAQNKVRPGNWEVEVDYPNYTLYIEADRKPPSQAAGIDKTRRALGIVVMILLLTAPKAC